MTRAERKAMKKAVGAKKKAPADEEEEDEDEEDEDLVNPNRMPAKAKKLVDLNAPQPMSRRERCVSKTLLFGRIAS